MIKDDLGVRRFREDSNGLLVEQFRGKFRGKSLQRGQQLEGIRTFARSLFSLGPLITPILRVSLFTSLSTEIRFKNVKKKIQKGGTRAAGGGSGARACGDSVARSQLIVQSAVNVHKTVVQQVHAPRRDATFDRVACINVATEALAHTQGHLARDFASPRRGLLARRSNNRARSIAPLKRHAALITLQPIAERSIIVYRCVPTNGIAPIPAEEKRDSRD